MGRESEEMVFHMDCPVCQKPMIILGFRNVELDFCPVCRGCWMDRGEFGLLLHGQPELPEDLKFQDEAISRRRCPRCGKKMRAGVLPGTPIEMDFCLQHGFWLDKDEPQAIAKAKADTRCGTAFIEWMSSVFAENRENISKKE